MTTTFATTEETTEMGNPTLKYTNDLSIFRVNPENRNIGGVPTQTIYDTITNATTVEELDQVPDSIRKIAAEVSATNFVLIESINVLPKQDGFYTLISGNRRLLGGLYSVKRAELTGEAAPAINYSYLVRADLAGEVEKLSAEFLENSSHEELDTPTMSSLLNRLSTVITEKLKADNPGVGRNELAAKRNAELIKFSGMTIDNVRIYMGFSKFPEAIQQDIIDNVVALHTVAKIQNEAKSGGIDFETAYNQAKAAAASQGVKFTQKFGTEFVQSLKKEAEHIEAREETLAEAPESIQDAVDTGALDPDAAFFAQVQSQQTGIPATEILDEATSASGETSPSTVEIKAATQRVAKKKALPVLEETEALDVINASKIGIDSVDFAAYDQDGLQALMKIAAKLIYDVSAIAGDVSSSDIELLFSVALNIEIQTPEAKSAYAHALSQVFENRINSVQTITSKQADEAAIAERQKERDAKKKAKELAKAEKEKEKEAQGKKATKTTVKKRKTKAEKAAEEMENGGDF